MSHTLIATLGRSPGAVTGLVRAIAEEKPDNIEIHHVHLLQTSHPDVKRASKVVCDHLAAFDNSIEISIETLDEADYVTTGAVAFQKIITDAIDRHVRVDHNIVMGIAGGRTSMGAMLAISAQLYAEVTHIYHLWVAADLEAKGDIRELMSLKQRDPASYDAVLAPPRHQRRLVALPTYSAGQRELIHTRKQVEQTPTHLISQDVQLSENLEITKDILRVLPRRMTIENAERFLKILNALHHGTPLDENTLLDVFQKEGITGAKALIEMMKRYSRREGDALALAQTLLEDFEESGHYWARGLVETYRRYREDLNLSLGVAQLGVGVAQLVLQVLGMHFKV